MGGPYRHVRCGHECPRSQLARSAVRVGTDKSGMFNRPTWWVEFQSRSAVRVGTDRARGPPRLRRPGVPIPLCGKGRYRLSPLRTAGAVASWFQSRSAVRVGTDMASAKREVEEIDSFNPALR